MQGIIYQSRHSSVHGEVQIHRHSKSHDKSFFSEFYRLTTSSLIVVAISSIIMAFVPVITEELTYLWYGQVTDIQNLVKTSDTSSAVPGAIATDLAQVQTRARDYGVNSSFSLVIPKINATSNIIANVDASSSTEYLKALKSGVAHAEGTYFPGQGKKIYLFSHSTDSPVNILRYNAVFYLLRKLEVGDTIIVFFADKEYRYVVTNTVIAEAEDISWLTDEAEDEELLLQTCDPPGTTLKRLIVVAKPER